jgi:Flp pilus assembly protein TadD
MQLAKTIQGAGLDDVAKGMADDLLKRSDAAVARNAKDGIAHYGRAVALRQLGDQMQARRAYKEAAALFPDDAQVQAEVGSYLVELSRWKEAESALRRAIQLNPQHATAYSNLAYALKHQNRLDEAAAAGRKSVALQPGEGRMWSVLATIYTQQRKVDPALDAYRRARRLGVIWPEVYLNQSMLLYQKKDYKGSAQIAEEGAGIFPDNPAMWTMIGAGYLETKEYDKSMAASREAIERNDSDAVAHHNLGMALLRTGKVAEGRKELERGLALGGHEGMVKEAKAMLAKYPG